MKFGIEWDYCNNGCAEDQARMIKSNGFDATFLDLEIDRLDDIMKALNKYEIVCESYHAPFNGINDMWIAGEKGDYMFGRLCRCIDDCNKYEVPVAVVHLSSGQTPPRMNDIGFERYDRLMEYADKKGVTIAYENIRRLDNVAYMLENYPQAGFCWDVGHEACYTQGMEFMPLFGKRLAAIHLHDNTAVYDADNHWIPYDGVIDMDKAAMHFAKSSYQGSLMLEVLPKTTKIYDLDVFYKRAYNAAVKFANTTEEYRKRLDI